MDASRLNGVANGVTTLNTDRTLPDICHTLQQKVLAFLDEQLEDPTLQKVQEQVRISNGVIEDALRRYG